MIVLRLIVGVFLFFSLCVLGLGLVLWLKVSLRLMNPFAASGEKPYMRGNDKVIEGEYKVLDESPKD